MIFISTICPPLSQSLTYPQTVIYTDVKIPHKGQNVAGLGLSLARALVPLLAPCGRQCFDQVTFVIVLYGVFAFWVRGVRFCLLGSRLEAVASLDLDVGGWEN